MRTVDILFVIILGIALGSILGKVWASTPAELMPMQLMFVCMIWALLRGVFALLGAVRSAIDWKRLLSPAFWRSGHRSLLKHGAAEHAARRPTRRRPAPQPEAPIHDMARHETRAMRPGLVSLSAAPTSPTVAAIIPSPL